MTPTPDSSPASENRSIHFHRFNESGLEIPVSDEQFFRSIQNVSEGEQTVFSSIEVVYVDEAGIISINREHLGKDYVTDIITFHYHDDPEEPVEATLYCCAPRIIEQAEEFGESVSREYLRVFIHGLLHLCGYDDATDQQKSVMKEKENYYLKAVT